LQNAAGRNTHVVINSWWKLWVVRILRANVGSVVTIECRDGEVVEAKISSIDSDEHNDVTYEVVSVRSSGPRRGIPAGKLLSS